MGSFLNESASKTNTGTEIELRKFSKEERDDSESDRDWNELEKHLENLQNELLSTKAENAHLKELVNDVKRLVKRIFTCNTLSFRS